MIDLKARPTNAALQVASRFRLLADFSLGPPNNSLYYGCPVNKLATAVTKRLPFRIDIQQPQVPLVRNGSMQLKIVASRDEGFDAPIHVQFPFRPPGLGTKPQIEIAKGQTEAFYPINANDKAQLGPWPVYAIGQADVQGPAWASSQLANLEIAAPFVTAELNRTVCEQGQETTIFCQLNHQRPFPGEATAELLGVPPQIEIPSLKFTSETKQLVFKVRTNDKSPVGRHKGLFCRITITDKGEPIVSTAARSELQITKPSPVDDDAAVTAQPVTPAKPQAKPKSRLQKLREAAQRKRGR